MPAPNGLLQVARTAAVLAVLGIAFGLARHSMQPDEHHAEVMMREATTRIAAAAHARSAASTAIEDAKRIARAAEGDAKAAVSRAVKARERTKVASQEEVSVPSSPNIEQTRIVVPAPVVERMRLDSTAVAALGALVERKDAVIVMQDQRMNADSLELIATSNAFTALRRVKEPRCGRRCGIVLGVGSMIAAAVAVEQLRRAYR